MVNAKDMAIEVREVKAGRGRIVARRANNNLEHTKDFCNEYLSSRIQSAAEEGNNYLRITFGCVHSFDAENVCLMYFKQKYWGVNDEKDVNLPKIKQILSDHGYKVNVEEKLLPYSSSEDLDGYRLEITW
jgi:hypothetical protein